MKIKFVPQDIEIEGDSSKSLLDLAKDAGIQIKSVCGGTPSCAECKVQVKEGEYNALPPSDTEIALIGTAHFVDRSRLSCQLRCFGDVTIDMHEQLEKQASGASTKRPRGKAQKAEGEESHAVEGSILLGGADLDIFGTTGEVGIDRTNERRAVQVFDDDETRRALEQIRRKRAAQSERSNSDDEYVKKLKNRDRKRDSYRAGDESDKSDSQKKSNSNKRNSKPKRNNNKNKNRNSNSNSNSNSNDRNKKMDKPDAKQAKTGSKPRPKNKKKPNKPKSKPSE